MTAALTGLGYQRWVLDLLLLLPLLGAVLVLVAPEVLAKRLAGGLNGFAADRGILGRQGAGLAVP